MLSPLLSALGCERHKACKFYTFYTGKKGNVYTPRIVSCSIPSDFPRGPLFSCWACFLKSLAFFQTFILSFSNIEKLTSRTHWKHRAQVSRKALQMGSETTSHRSSAKSNKPASLRALLTSSATSAPQSSLSLQRKREKRARWRMPGKSNPGKNNTFQLGAKPSFPVPVADVASGMLGRAPALGTGCKTQVSGKMWTRDCLLSFNS